MKNNYIYYYQIAHILEDYSKNNSEFMGFRAALQIAIKNNLSIEQKTMPPKRTQFSEAEFTYYIDHTQIDMNYHANAHKSTDSSLIPSSLDIFCMKHLVHKQQIIHPHDCFDIHYMYKGYGCLIFEDEVQFIDEGEICIIAPQSKYKIYPNNNDDIVITIYIRNSSFESLFFDTFSEYDLISLFIRSVLYNSKNKANYLLFKSQNNSDIKEIIQNIYIETNYVDQYSNNVSIQEIHLLFISILRDYTLKHSYKNIHNIENQYFLDILEYVQNNYTTVSIRELSQRYHYNESYLSSLFVKLLGLNFVSIITNLKIAKAKSLLAETTFTVSKISELVGYTSVDHFSRTFKKETAYTPSLYRKTHVR